MKRHELCLNSMADLSISEDGDNTWTVSCLKKNVSFKIEKCRFSCDCRNRCDYCNCCIHAYVCSCDDSYIKMNMCIHIHLVCQFIQQLDSSSDLIPVSLDNNLIFACSTLGREESNVMINAEQISQIDNFKIKKVRLMEQLKKILELVQTNDELKIVENALLPLSSTINLLKQKENVT